MTDQDRREFLRKSAAAAAALGISGTAAAAGQSSRGPGLEPAADGAPAGQATSQRGETLGALGEAVLPAEELGRDGVSRVVADFDAWIEGFVPGAEQPHGYLSRGLAEIRYGPEHPGPRWAAQIEALDADARQRHGRAFAEISVDERRGLIEARLDAGELDRMPTPARAHHVAIGLMAHFYGGAEATDLCYRARIGRYRCRGLDEVGREPTPLPGGPGPGARDEVSSKQRGRTGPDASLAPRGSPPTVPGDA